MPIVGQTPLLPITSVASLEPMTTSLQELVDDSIFISTEHQARLAELSQDVEWDVDFSVPSFTLQSDPPVVLTPHLLGTDSVERNSWIWSWQELGHFPAEVVAAAIQTRESAARLDVSELITDELPTHDGMARQLTLAAKALTGIWAHYPARVSKNVTAWLLLDGPDIDLGPVKLETMMQVIAEALQTDTAVDHNRALDSYAKLRGVHIQWDTDAMCVITTRDGAQRFWLEEHKITGVEPAEPLVGEEELERLEQDARTRREALAADRADARKIAQDQEAREVVSEESSVPTSAQAEPTADSTYPAAPSADADLPYDQEPRRDVAPGEVVTTTVPVLTPEPHAEQTPESPSQQATPEPIEHTEQPEQVPAMQEAQPPVVEEDPAQPETQEQKPQPKKKGFFNRFFFGS